MQITIGTYEDALMRILLSKVSRDVSSSASVEAHPAWVIVSSFRLGGIVGFLSHLQRRRPAFPPLLWHARRHQL